MKRQLSDAQLDALAAWWLSKRHIGKAALLLNRSRQTVANTLNTMRRLEEAADTVEVALNHLDEIQARRDSVMDRAA